MVELTPTVDDVPVWSDAITPYDEQHFVTYVRLLDADAAHADWREVARIVLGLDPDREPERAERCWKLHLDRAKWMVAAGYRQLMDRARQS